MWESPNPCEVRGQERVYGTSLGLDEAMGMEPPQWDEWPCRKLKAELSLFLCAHTQESSRTGRALVGNRVLWDVGQK